MDLLNLFCFFCFFSFIEGVNLEPEKLTIGQAFFKEDIFRMGNKRRELLPTGEYPLRDIQLKAFSIDRYPVTNSDFRAFKKEKPNYQTTAEKAGYSWILKGHKTEVAELIPGVQNNEGEHWEAVKGASWERPFGPGSDLEELEKYPVIHVSFTDAYAFCQWAGKKMASEYEWEYAAKGGYPGNKYPWGNFTHDHRSNTWQGKFPVIDISKDGFSNVSPVDAFPAQNNYGMFDMIGNTWEWTGTQYKAPRGLLQPEKPEYILKGGSFIDSIDGRTNEEIRTTLRKPKDPDYTAQNLGFRCSNLLKKNQVTPKMGVRAPVHHKYEETWEYKSKKIFGKAHNVEEL